MVLRAPWCEQQDTITKPLGVTKQRAISCKKRSFSLCSGDAVIWWCGESLSLRSGWIAESLNRLLATTVRYLLPNGLGYRLHVGCTKAMCGESQVFCSMGLNHGVWPWNRLRSVPMYRKSLRSGESTNRLIGESNSCCLVVESLSRWVDSVSRIRSLSLSTCCWPIGKKGPMLRCRIWVLR